MNFSIRGMCITLLNAFLYADFKQCPVMWIDGHQTVDMPCGFVGLKLTIYQSNSY